MPYEIVEHTADVGLEIRADSLGGLMVEAGRGLMGVMGSGGGPQVEGVGVELSSPDVEALLVDWLSELLYLFEVRGLVFTDADVRIGEPGSPGGDWTLTAGVRGLDASGFEQGGPGVKAVTYHALEVAGGASGWRARVYLDV